MNLVEIVMRLRSGKNDLVSFCSTINDDLFFFQPYDKWSIAQNVKHLDISVKRTKLAYSLPKFLVRIFAGKPNRISRTYDEVVEKYKTRLKQGGNASGLFIPKNFPAGSDKTLLLKQFDLAVESLAKCIEKKWADHQLDKYLAPHPLLGKITLRELGYFTIHHTSHHLEIIKARL